MMLQKKRKKKSLKEHNPNWLQIIDHPDIILITGGSGFVKILLFNLTSQQPDTGKSFLYSIYPYEAKCQLLTNKK